MFYFQNFFPRDILYQYIPNIRHIFVSMCYLIHIWGEGEEICLNGDRISEKMVYVPVHTKDHRYRKDRLPRAYFCCRQLAKFRIVRGICLYNTLHWLVCYKPAGQSFPEFGVWVSVDFDSKYKIVWGETSRAGHSLFISRFALRSPLFSFPWIAIALALI